jgi:hypothetical protein
MVVFYFLFLVNQKHIYYQWFAKKFFILNLYKKYEMKKIMVYTFGIFILNSCTNISGSGNIVTEKRQVSDFTGISTGGSYEVELKKGPANEVLVESDDNIIKYIETRVVGDMLLIKTKGSYNFMNSHTKITVTAPEINLLKCSGAASIQTEDVFSSLGKISIEASGAAGIEANFDAPEISTKASGASKIEINGRTRNHKASTSGSADIKAGGLLTEISDVRASGASSIHVHASVRLNAEASGSASVYYRGGASVQQKVSGAADVKKED